MAKDLDPKTSAPAEIVSAQAEEVSKSAIDIVAEQISDRLGKQMGEMFREYRAQEREGAEKALAGKPEEASKPDAANLYAPQAAAEFARMLGQFSAPKATEKEEVTAFKAMCLGAAYAVKSKDVYRGLDEARKDGHTDKTLNIMSKALGVDVAANGGFLLPSEDFGSVVPELLSETAMFNDNAIRVVPVNGELQISYESSGPTANWTAENAGSNASQPAYAQMTLRPQQASEFVAVSRKMLAGVPGIAADIERSMRRKMATAVDAKLIRGDGTLNTPMGLRYKADSSNVLTVNASVTAANVVSDLITLQSTLQGDDVPWSPATARHIISPRTWGFLFGLRATDNYVFQQEMLSNRILGVPIAGQSGRGISSVPENLSVTDSSESEIYLYETSGLILGVSTDLRMEMTTEGAYRNSSGTTVSAFSLDQAVFKLVYGVDLGTLYRGLEIAVLSDVDWGV